MGEERGETLTCSSVGVGRAETGCEEEGEEEEEEDEEEEGADGGKGANLKGLRNEMGAESIKGCGCVGRVRESDR